MATPEWSAHKPQMPVDKDGNWISYPDYRHVSWVPADLIESIDYFLTSFDKSRTHTNAGYNLIELFNAVSELKSWHPGYDIDTGTLPYEREEE